MTEGKWYGVYMGITVMYMKLRYLMNTFLYVNIHREMFLDNGYSQMHFSALQSCILHIT